MMEPEFQPPEFQPPTEVEAPIPPPPPREPFWGYSDLLAFAGMVLPCFFFAFGVVPWVAHFDAKAHPWQVVPEQLALYGLLLLALAAMFRFQYDRPLWRSLGWVRMGVPWTWPIVAGVLTAIAVVLVAFAIQVPTKDTPMTKLLQTPGALIPIAIFGVTVAPLMEELVFRGFLQPLLVRSLGALLGILAANIPFGVLHYAEYGNSWRHVVVIGLAGTAFGAMRHRTGSTRASAVMHAFYNAFFFYAQIKTKM